MLNFLSLYHFFVNLDFARMPETREQQGKGSSIFVLFLH